MNTKFLAVALAAVAGAAFADSTSVTTDYVLGVLPVEMKAGQTEVALNIPWVEPGSTGEGVAVTNLVKTSSLAKGDSLFWYDGSSYKGWAVNGSNNWDPATVVVAGGISTSPATDVQTLNRGQALILRRTNATAVTNVYIVGQWKATAGLTSTIAAATAVSNDGFAGVKPTYSLIASPSAEDEVDLSVKLAASETFVPARGDTVTFAKADGTVTTYTYGKYTDGGSLGWGQAVNDNGYKFVAPAKGAMTIKAGNGFWYKRCAETPLTIYW